MIHILIYSISKGLTVITFAIIFHQAINFGRCNWHNLLCIPIDRGNNMSFHQMIELAIQKSERY